MGLETKARGTIWLLDRLLYLMIPSQKNNKTAANTWGWAFLMIPVLKSQLYVAQNASRSATSSTVLYLGPYSHEKTQI